MQRSRSPTGLSEFQSKIGDRIQFVQLAEKISKTEYGKRTFFLGTDPIGRDVLAQMLWACRLSISIGLVSTGLSVLLGIVIGALMGYFGGWVDLVLSRVVEIFMAVPVLFLSDRGGLGSAAKHLRDDDDHRLRDLDRFSSIHPCRISQAAKSGFRAKLPRRWDCPCTPCCSGTCSPTESPRCLFKPLSVLPRQSSLKRP